FFHQLVASQLDMDRLDYLKRDSFFTGVNEGAIGLDRIISMLHVVNDQIVVEEKGIYSIENFLNARRLMYWQVYLHKASVSAEKMLINLIVRAKELASSGEQIFATEPFNLFLTNNITLEDFQQNNSTLKTFGLLDDYDIWASIKIWSKSSDKILRMLSNSILNRELFGIELTNQPLSKKSLAKLRLAVADKFDLVKAEARFLLAHGEVTNKAYIMEGEKINILTKQGDVMDVAKAADLPNITAMSKIVKKHYLCFPKTVTL
ncbi:MAG: phosphohydrolase, partial [Fulvivirga sp.]|nr:phosphohydrolase [Fulvivirga sp.]